MKNKIRTGQKILVIVVSERKSLSESLSYLLASNSSFDVAIDHTPADLMETDIQEQPDVIIFIPRDFINSMEQLKALRRKYQSSKIIIMSMSENYSEVFQFMDNGADGFISAIASPDEVQEAVRMVHKNGSYLPEFVKNNPFGLPRDFRGLSMQERERLIKFLNKEADDQPWK